MTDQSTIRQEHIRRWLSSWIVRTPFDHKFSVTPLAGDGSVRKFFRVDVSEHSFVVLSDPDWLLSRDYSPHQSYLKSKGLPVPNFIEEDAKAGILVMEDLGDGLLQKEILKDPRNTEQHLQRAVELLAELHGKTYPIDTTIPASTRTFDTTKYFEELEYTYTHLAQGLLGLDAPEQKHLQAVDRYCRAISRTEPVVFCHRDYHTRNILLTTQGSLCLIDFQDARLGPIYYDLASLLYDPYVPIDNRLRKVLEQHYFKRLSTYPLFDSVDRTHGSAQMAAIAFQRMVKVAGSFASFYTRHGKKAHLPYLIPALLTALQLSSHFDITEDLKLALPLEDWIERSHKVISQIEGSG